MKNYIMAMIVLVISGCGQPEVKIRQSEFNDSGKASFYSDEFESRQTASGEIYRHKLKTAAHRYLSFGMKVKVTNVDNNRSVIVTINDRGPFTEGRIIDLSRSAFEQIADPELGVIDVRTEIVR